MSESITMGDQQSFGSQQQESARSVVRRFSEATLSSEGFQPERLSALYNMDMRLSAAMDMFDFSPALREFLGAVLKTGKADQESIDDIATKMQQSYIGSMKSNAHFDQMLSMSDDDLAHQIFTDGMGDVQPDEVAKDRSKYNEKIRENMLFCQCDMRVVGTAYKYISELAHELHLEVSTPLSRLAATAQSNIVAQSQR